MDKSSQSKDDPGNSDLPSQTILEGNGTILFNKYRNFRNRQIKKAKKQQSKSRSRDMEKSPPSRDVQHKNISTRSMASNI